MSESEFTDRKQGTERPDATVGQRRLAYSVNEAAAIAGLSRSWLYGEITAGRLRTRKAGRRRLVLHTDLVSFLDGLPET